MEAELWPDDSRESHQSPLASDPRYLKRASFARPEVGMRVFHRIQQPFKAWQSKHARAGLTLVGLRSKAQQLRCCSLLLAYGH